ncbi:hypothetical protein ScPMuIL_013955 [Solemya velum]
MLLGRFLQTSSLPLPHSAGPLKICVATAKMKTTSLMQLKLFCGKCFRHSHSSRHMNNNMLDGNMNKLTDCASRYSSRNCASGNGQRTGMLSNKQTFQFRNCSKVSLEGARHMSSFDKKANTVSTEFNGIDHGDAVVPDSAWACRLANENGYLSWCRNTYLASAVGVAMIVEGQTTMAEYTGDATLLIAAINMAWGTWSFIYNIVVQRKRVQMSIPIVLFNIFAAVGHLILWMAVIFTYAAVWKNDGTKSL